MRANCVNVWRKVSIQEVLAISTIATTTTIYGCGIDRRKINVS